MRPDRPAGRDPVSAPPSPGGVRVDRVVTSGTPSLDGDSRDVDTNVWVVGDATECVVIDPAHDAGPILRAVAKRRVLAILCTDAHEDRISALGDLCGATRAPSYLHPADLERWYRVYPGVSPDNDLADGDVVRVGDVELRALHTPGRTSGAVCFHAPDLGVVFTGETLVGDGPGAPGRPVGDLPTVLESIRTRLLTLPPETLVHAGHGDDTSIAAQALHLQERLGRGR